MNRRICIRIVKFCRGEMTNHKWTFQEIIGSLGKTANFFMSESSDQPVSSGNAYLIISCNTVEELAGKVSKALAGGTMSLHGPPFVFKDQVCQALKSSNHG